MARKLSELLSELAEKAHQLENKFASAKEGTEEQLQQWKDDLKTKNRAEKAAFEEKVEMLDGNVKSHWEGLRSNFDHHIIKVKEDFKRAQYSLKASNAENDAMFAEEDAEMSVYFALEAMSEAEQAIIEAVKARKIADSY